MLHFSAVQSVKSNGMLHF